MNDFISHKSDNADYCIVAGDLNFTFAHQNQLWEAVNCFLKSCKLFNTHDRVVNTPGYTYKHHSLNQMSVIDYIFVSESLYNSIIDVCVKDSGLNLSDHVPIVACFKGNFEAKCNSDKSIVKEKNVVKSLRWDKADLSK